MQARKSLGQVMVAEGDDEPFAQAPSIVDDFHMSHLSKSAHLLLQILLANTEEEVA